MISIILISLGALLIAIAGGALLGPRTGHVGRDRPSPFDH